MMTFTAAPPAAPCSASNALLLTFTYCTASPGGTYAILTGSQGYETGVPSNLVLLAWDDTPFMYTVMARCGLPASEFASLLPAPMPAPGSRNNRLWKFLPSPPLYGSSCTSCADISEWMS